jgi:YD repeat-containing protein
VYGWKAILTKDGQILEKQNLGKDHESSILNSEGWAKVRYTYTEGEVTAEEYFDTQGDRVNTAIGAKRAATYENGRLMQVELFDKDNQPTWCDQGWSSSKRKYDSRGYLLEEAYFAPNGDPTCIHSGYHKIQLHCDEEGNVTDERFLGIDGQLVYTIDGWAISRAKYEGGQQVEVSYFGTNEDPILNTNGVHMETRLYEAGLLKEVRFFGTGGRSDPVTSTEGCSIVRLGYDEQRNEVSRSNFDEHDQPVVTSEGYHRLKREYDKTRGLVKRVEYHSAPGESLTMVKDGYAVSENEYNSQGKLVRQTFFGKDRQPIEREGGYHAIEVDYDEQGRIVETRHYDTNRKLQHFEGTPIVRTTYDAFGRETSKRFFTADHQKTTHADGNHGWDAQYDPRGNQTIKCFVDTENKPFLIKNGYAKVRKTYDALGRNTSVRYFDTADQPTTDSFAGCHGWDAQYDAHGNMTIQISVDTENKPFETKYGYAKLQMTYDAQGRNTSVRYFNAAGQPTTHKSDGNHGWDAQYDHLGNQTLRCFVNTDNEPFEIKNGYAKVRTTYNPMGWKTSERYFDAADQPTTHNSDGNHGWDSKYETHENMTIQIQISVDTENKPFETKYGVTKARKTYDVLRRKTSERYFDATDQPTKLKREGNHGWDAQYDAHGNMTIQISVDTENKPFETENGYAKVRMTYDALGRQTSVRHFDATDQPTTVKPDGNHGWDAQYDLRGNRTLESYVDTDNKPFEITNGYATVKKIYDNLGRETSVRFLGVDGKLATDKSTGSLGWDAEYDLPGNHPNECLVRRTILFNQTNSVSEVRELIDEAKKTSVLTFYDTDGKQVRQPLHGALEVKVIDLGTYKVTEHLDCDGRSRCSKVVVTKNKNGLESREEYFDSEGEPVFLTGRTDVFPNYSVYQVQLDNDEATAWYSGFSEKREFDQVRIVRNDLQGTQRFTFHTQDGQQVSNEDGVGSIREWYQPDGIAERAFFDLQDNPMVTKEGFHSSKSTPTTAIKDATTKYQEFDRDYNEIRSVLANKDNEMILQSDGFAYHRRTYDQKRRIITDRYFGLDDQPAADVLGEYGIKHEYDATGTVIRSFYLGIDGTVQPSLLGISGIGFHYNDADRVIDNTYIDEAGNPIQAMNGASGFRLMYSGSLERDYYGKEKQPLQPIGLVVVKILEDSFASNAGLELGTVILEVNQKKLRSHTELREEIAALAASKSIQEYPIKFLQAGKIMEVSVPAGKLGVQTTTYYGVETLVEDKD